MPKKVAREFRECLCGCGYKKEVRITDHWDFKAGHQNRGRKHTKKSRNKMIKNNVHYWFGKFGEEHPAFKGYFQTKSFRGKDYVLRYYPNHPNHKGMYVPYHRLVVEEQIGRYLLRTESCHHINEITIDNRVVNLMCFNSESAHRRFHKFGDAGVGQWEIVFDGRMKHMDEVEKVTLGRF